MGSTQTNNRKNLNSNLLGYSEFDAPTFNTFAMQCMSYGARVVEKFFLEESLGSGEFLDYDRESNKFRVGPLQQTLIDLRGAIDSYVGMSKDPSSKDLFAKHGTMDPTAKVRVSNTALIMPLALLDAHDRVAEMLTRAHKALHGKPVPLSGIPQAPSFVSTFNVPIRSLPTIAEVQSWIEDI